MSDHNIELQKQKLANSVHVNQAHIVDTATTASADSSGENQI